MIRRHLARRLAPTLALAACLAAPAPALAASPADQAAAEALFREGRKLMAAGDFEHACPKLLESQRLDPAIGTQLSIGDCLEKAGKLASSWGAFKAAEATARNENAPMQAAEAQRRAEALAPRLARLAIVVPPAAKVPGFEVRRDGELVGEGQWGSPVPTDTGWHKIEATAPGKKPWTTQVRVEADGSSASVNVPELEVQSTVTAAAPAPFWGGQRIAGAAVGGAGLVGLVIGTVFGVRAIGKKSDADKQCLPDNPNVCYPAGMTLRQGEKTAGTASTASFVVGGVLAAGGIVLFLTAPGSSQKKADALGLHLGPAVAGSGLSVGGRW